MNNSKHTIRDRIIIILICLISIAFAFVVYFTPEIYFNTGKKYFDKGDYVNAYKNFNNAYSIDRNSKKIRYYYVKTLTKLTPTLKIQKELFEFSESKNNDSAKLLAGIKIAQLKERFTAKLFNNYIEQIPGNNGVIRWDKKSFPIKVAFVSNVDNLPDYFKIQTLKAISQWENSTGFIKFKLINTPEDADIFIKVDKMPADVCSKAGCNYVLGHTIPTIEKNILKKMTITLYNKDPYGRYFSDKELYNTVLHELGHALGIMGHSYSENDLMYIADTGSNALYNQYRSAFQYISAPDLNTIKLLYQMVPDVSNIPIENMDTTGLIYAPIIIGNEQTRSSQKLKEAENYIKKAPDIPGGYIDKAIALSELDNLAEATISLEKALSLAKRDDEKFVIYYNMAVIYINGKMPDKALPYAEKAKAISNTSDIQKLIEDIKKQQSSQNS